MQWDLDLLSHGVEYNDENKILNGYHMSEINYFKVLLLCKMMRQIMLIEYWRDMIWLDTNIDILHVKKLV
jgi:hypothetical protein